MINFVNSVNVNVNKKKQKVISIYENDNFLYTSSYILFTLKISI